MSDKEKVDVVENLERKKLEAIEAIARRIENTKKTDFQVFNEVDHLIKAASPMFRFIFGREVKSNTVTDVLAWQMIAYELASVATQIAEKVKFAGMDYIIKQDEIYNQNKEKEDKND